MQLCTILQLLFAYCQTTVYWGLKFEHRFRPFRGIIPYLLSHVALYFILHCVLLFVLLKQQMRKKYISKYI